MDTDEERRALFNASCSGLPPEVTSSRAAPGYAASARPRVPLRYGGGPPVGAARLDARPLTRCSCAFGHGRGRSARVSGGSTRMRVVHAQSGVSKTARSASAARSVTRRSSARDHRTLGIVVRSMRRGPGAYRHKKPKSNFRTPLRRPENSSRDGSSTTVTGASSTFHPRPAHRGAARCFPNFEHRRPTVTTFTCTRHRSPPHRSYLPHSRPPFPDLRPNALWRAAQSCAHVTCTAFQSPPYHYCSCNAPQNRLCHQYFLLGTPHRVFSYVIASR